MEDVEREKKVKTNVSVPPGDSYSTLGEKNKPKQNKT